MLALRPFKRYFEFSGRSGRAEFWQFYLLMWGVLIAAYLVQHIIGDKIGLISSLIGLVCVIPQMSVSVRRLHDIDCSGWWMAGAMAAIFFISIASASYSGDSKQMEFKLWVLPIVIVGCLILAMCSRGDEGENRFGWPDTGANEVEEYYVEQGPEPVAVVTQTDPEDGFRQIERLGDLRDRGLLTDEEFAAKKSAILARS